MNTIASSLRGPYRVVIELLASDKEELLEADCVSIIDGVYVITTPKPSVFTYPANAVALSIVKD